MKSVHLIMAMSLLTIGSIGFTALAGCAATPTVATSAHARQRLAQPVLINFHNTPFNKAVATLAKSANVNVCIQTPALANAGIQMQTPVTLHFTRPVSIRVALDALLKTVGNPGQPLGWRLHKGVLLITTRDMMKNQTITRVYNIKALIVHRTGTGKTKVDPQEVNLAQVIENTVDRNSWIDNGGNVASLRFLHYSMVVTTTPADQDAIAHLLSKLKNGAKDKN